MAGVAVPHPSTLQNLACVRRLFQLDAVAPLLHLDAQIETQQPQITHLKLGTHLFLELGDLRGVRSSDDQVVDIDADE
jgi:hypothetical protein